MASFNRDATGAVSVGTIDVFVGGSKLFGDDDPAAAGTANGLLDTETTTTNRGAPGVSVANLDITAAYVQDDDLSDMIPKVDTALKGMTTGASNLGAAMNRMDIQSEFVSNLRDSIEKGVGTLVDADMTEESTRLKALQTQQQLGVQALSIANSSSESLLLLFR
ncbi:hypothetical protein H9Q09_21670 [Aurantimonas sp. DM33-3]|uniref:flagellin n=1 Tax=Aurantimonas sp. DM33-3 TaxID=2766955 RepID=UPI001651EEE4|nr:hypothetical protein [Aurantimonas sp. DM33-3]